MLVDSYCCESLCTVIDTALREPYVPVNLVLCILDPTIKAPSCT